MEKKEGGILKKRIWLGVFIAVCVAGIVYWYSDSRPQEIAVETRQMTASAVQETVTCKGRVEATEQTEVKVQTDCVVANVLTKKGAQVHKGDVLITVDTEKTLSVLAQSDGAAAVDVALSDGLISEITAPCDGTVSELIAQDGGYLGEQQVCAVISAHEPVQIRLSIPEREIARIAVEQRVVVSGVGFEKQEYHGYVSELAPIAKQEMTDTGNETTVEAVVMLDKDQADESLRVGLTAKGAITVSVVQAGFIVPYDAVAVDDDNRECVYVLTGNAAQKRMIEPIAELTEGYLVADVFSNGEHLILQADRITENGVYYAKESADD